MRSASLLLVVSSLASSSLPAQQPPKPAPFALAVGPAWNAQLTGLHFRAEYNLIGDRWFGLQVDAGGLWTPTQNRSVPSILYGDDGRYEGVAQATDLHFGLAAILTPWPRARISPYLVTGVAAVQSWSTGEGVYRNADGSLAQPVPRHSFTHGDFVAVTGFGLRGRVGGHPIRLELRRYGRTNALTLGTGLRF